MTPPVASGRVVVGIDGKPASVAALAWAAAEAAARQVGLDAVLAWHPPALGLTDDGPGAVDPFPFRADAQRILDGAIDLLGARIAGLDVRATAVEGRAAATLIEHTRGAAMLVVGTRGRSVLGLSLGSVSRQCAAHAHCPVVVVPPKWSRAESLSRIVVGVDGSAGSARALRWAAEAARIHDASLDVIHVWQAIQPVPDISGMVFALDRDLLEKASHELLDEAAAAELSAVPLVPGRVHLLPVEGYPAGALHAAAAGADLLVVGSRGRGGFARLLLGSVAEQCLHRAPVPVAIIRPADEGPQERNTQ
jgi:nucleotide-binding universal stress UspA family protein